MHPPVALRAGGMCANTRAREGMHGVVWRGKTLSVDSFSIVWEMADPCVCGRGG